MNKVKLSDITFIKMGQSPQGSTCNVIGNGIPLSNGPTEFTEFYPIPKQYTTDAKRFSEINEILFCVRGSTTGRMNWSDRVYALGRGLASLSHKKGKEYNYFLKYLIQYNLDSILRTTNGSTFPNLTSDMLASFEFIVPENSIQKKISKFLSALDSKIEINNRINAELEAMAKTIYDYWFVQFDFPNEEGKPYKTSGGKMVWNKELKREIPEGWEVVTVESLLSKESNSKKIQSSEYFKKGSTPIIDQSTDFIAGFTNDKDSIINTIEPRIVFGDHTRIIKLINFDFARGADGTQILLSNNKKMPQHLFYHNLLKIDLSNYGYARHFKFLKVNSVILPNENISNRFEMLIKSFFDLIKDNIFQNLQLSELRDWLLPMLMNGQVRVE